MLELDQSCFSSLLNSAILVIVIHCSILRVPTKYEKVKKIGYFPACKSLEINFLGLLV